MRSSVGVAACGGHGSAQKQEKDTAAAKLRRGSGRRRLDRSELYYIKVCLLTGFV